MSTKTNLNIDDVYFIPSEIIRVAEESDRMMEDVIPDAYKKVKGFQTQLTNAIGSQAHPIGVPPQFFGDYIKLYTLIGDVSAMIEEQEIGVVRNQTTIYTEQNEETTAEVLSARNKKQQIKHLKMKLRRYFRRKLQCYLNAMAANPNLWVQQQCNVSDLPMIKLHGIDCKMNTNQYKRKTSQEDHNPCVIRLLEMKEAYEATFSTCKMNELKKSDVEWDDWHGMEPWITCYRVHFKHRIGEWLMTHTHLWENTINCNGIVCDTGCMCRQIIE